MTRIGDLQLEPARIDNANGGRQRDVGFATRQPVVQPCVGIVGGVRDLLQRQAACIHVGANARTDLVGR